jgi:hypothetical protein
MNYLQFMVNIFSFGNRINYYINAKVRRNVIIYNIKRVERKRVALTLKNLY